NRSEYTGWRHPNGLEEIRGDRRRPNRDRAQFCDQSRLSHRPRLYDLPKRKLPRRPASRQHGQIATGAASNRETLASKNKRSRTDRGFEPPETAKSFPDPANKLHRPA